MTISLVLQICSVSVKTPYSASWDCEKIKKYHYYKTIAFKDFIRKQEAPEQLRFLLIKVDEIRQINKHFACKKFQNWCNFLELL